MASTLKLVKRSFKGVAHMSSDVISVGTDVTGQIHKNRKQISVGFCNITKAVLVEAPETIAEATFIACKEAKMIMGTQGAPSGTSIEKIMKYHDYLEDRLEDMKLQKKQAKRNGDLQLEDSIKTAIKKLEKHGDWKSFIALNP